MFLRKIFPAPEVKILKKFAGQFLDECTQSLRFQSFSKSKLIKEIKTELANLADTKEMLALLTSDDPPILEYQSLHSIGQIIIHLLSRPPLVDIGGGSYCSLSYRDALGNLTDEGKDIRALAHALVDKIVTKKFEERSSEYIINFIDVVDDATKPNTNRHFSGF